MLCSAHDAARCSRTIEALRPSAVPGRLPAAASGLPPPVLALNCVGGSSATAIAKILSHGATHVTYGAMSLQPLSPPTSLLIFKGISFRGFWISGGCVTFSLGFMQCESSTVPTALCIQAPSIPRHPVSTMRAPSPACPLAHLAAGQKLPALWHMQRFWTEFQGIIWMAHLHRQCAEAQRCCCVPVHVQPRSNPPSAVSCVDHRYGCLLHRRLLHFTLEQHAEALRASTEMHKRHKVVFVPSSSGAAGLGTCDPAR
jgi:hypothetical protein